ncbi:MAG: TIGR03905 family TSCPD domain-containing protein [Clostridiales bacterium]|nr:TIGR03905 family TSCPD domain-containing protein [Clostridiales bacterium]
MFKYKTQYTCAREIQFEIENDVITFVKFVGGCTGNTQGIAKLCIGRRVDEVISLLEGTICRMGTSCPDQLAKALKKYKEEN